MNNWLKSLFVRDLYRQLNHIGTVLQHFKGMNEAAFEWNSSQNLSKRTRVRPSFFKVVVMGWGLGKHTLCHTPATPRPCRDEGNMSESCLCWKLHVHSTFVTGSKTGCAPVSSYEQSTSQFNRTLQRGFVGGPVSVSQPVSQSALSI